MAMLYYPCVYEGSTSMRRRAAAILGNFGAALGQVISFSPNWNPIFIQENITLTCNVVDSSTQDEHGFSWYKDGEKIGPNRQSLEILSAEWSDAGSYQCQAGDVRSRAVALNITDDALVLQAPPSIFEGEDLPLRCHSLSGTSGGNTTFYKDGRLLGKGPNVYNLEAELNSTGNYKCAKQITRYNSPENQEASERHISVTELFSSPDVTLSADPVMEGSEMTVSCVTHLNPRRAGTQLEFAFYRNRLEVQGFGSSDTYKVQSVQEEDAGSYTCEVRTSSNHMKRSREYRVHMTELFSYPVLQVTSERIKEGDAMTVICNTTLNPSTGNNTRLEFAFYNSGRKVQGFGLSDKYQVESVQTGDAGYYSCAVRTSTNHVNKTSRVTHVELSERSLRILILMLALIGSFLVVIVIVTGLLLFRHSFRRVTQQLTMEPELEEMDVSYAPVLVNCTGRAAPASGTENVDAILYSELRNTDVKLCSSLTEQRNP